MDREIKSTTLHLGCGAKKEPGSLGVDQKSYPGVDVIHDLEQFPYPLPDSQFERVVAIDVLEHLDHIVGAMEEIYRVSKNHAEVVITGPYATSMDRHHDPTHRRGFTRLSFDYFIAGKDHYERYHYPTQARFNLQRFGFCLNEPHTLFRRFMVKLANTFPRFYESHLPYLYPMDYVYFILRTKKE